MAKMEAQNFAQGYDNDTLSKIRQRLEAQSSDVFTQSFQDNQYEIEDYNDNANQEQEDNFNDYQQQSQMTQEKLTQTYQQFGEAETGFNNQNWNINYNNTPQQQEQSWNPEISQQSNGQNFQTQYEQQDFQHYATNPAQDLLNILATNVANHPAFSTVLNEYLQDNPHQVHEAVNNACATSSYLQNIIAQSVENALTENPICQQIIQDACANAVRVQLTKNQYSAPRAPQVKTPQYINPANNVQNFPGANARQPQQYQPQPQQPKGALKQNFAQNPKGQEDSEW